ncbi:MAG: hypothetical protein OHK0038_27070 [Flammeovirgaceae bacterium]
MQTLNPKNIPHDIHHLDKYLFFCELYGIEDVEQFVKLYEIDELLCFMPSTPNEQERKALQELVGVESPMGYMDYNRTNNTFELIMQWQEKLNHFYHTTPFLAN